MSQLNPDIAFASVKDEEARATALKKAAAAFAAELVKQTPPGHEQTLAFRKVEEAVLWALAAQQHEAAYKAAAREDAKAAKKAA